MIEDWEIQELCNLIMDKDSPLKELKSLEDLS